MLHDSLPTNIRVQEIVVPQENIRFHVDCKVGVQLSIACHMGSR